MTLEARAAKIIDDCGGSPDATRHVVVALREVRAQALEDAAQACRDERVDADTTQAPEDAAYNAAIEHCADAIRALKDSP